MNRFVLMGMLSGLAISASSAGASAPDHQKEFDACLERAGGLNNMNLDHCATATVLAAETEISELIRQIYRMIEPDSLEAAGQMNLSQDTWLRYRGEHCALVNNYVGQPAGSMCWLNLTIQRVAELREMHQEMNWDADDDTPR